MFKTLAFIVALSGVATAFNIPEGLGDGVYTMYKNRHGKEVFEFVGPANTTARDIAQRQLSSLPSDASVGCAPGVITEFDRAGAISGLLGICDGSTQIGSGQHLTSVSGAAVAYMCNYGSSGINACHSNEATPAFAAVGTGCPNQQTGKLDKTFDMITTYG